MKDQSNSNKDLEAILHPYLFVLKEGGDIENNYLDYSLLMLHVSAPEVIHSPGSNKVMSFLPAALLLNEQISSDNKSPTQSDPST
jgi:hypothetical protein